MEPITVVMLLAVGLAVLCVVQFVKNSQRAKAEDKVLKGYFLLGLSGIMAKIALADGRVTDDETELAKRFFDRMNLTEAERATCVGNFVIARRDGLTARDHANRFLAYADPDASQFLYGTLWRIARADGVLDPAEDKLLHEVALYLGLTETAYERFKKGDEPHYDKAQLRKAGVPQTVLGLIR